jgi:hypothetical protein
METFDVGMHLKTAVARDAYKFSGMIDSVTVEFKK